jgi:hypothetical protein
MTPNITPQLSTVSREKSILPTGRLKFKEGTLFQEALVFIHISTSEEQVGLTHKWFPVDAALIEEIRSS